MGKKKKKNTGHGKRDRGRKKVKVVVAAVIVIYSILKFSFFKIRHMLCRMSVPYTIKIPTSL